MELNNNEITPAEKAEQDKIGEAGGMGPLEEKSPQESEEDKPEEKEEKSEEESEESEAEDDDEEESDEDESEEEESEEEDDEDENEDEDEEPEDSRPGKHPARTVPYSLLKDERKKVKALTEDIRDIKEILGTLTKKKDDGKTAEEEIDEIVQEAKKLEEGTNIDSAILEKILKSAVELAQKKYGAKIPKEIEDKLKLLDKLEKKDIGERETAHFDKEWNAVLPDLKKQYPNADDSQISELKKLVDEVAHSKKFHDKDLDYVIFKNKKKIDAILKVAPKGKSGEPGRTIGQQKDLEENDEELTDLEDITPDVMKKRDEKSASGQDSNPKDYKIQNPK